MAVSEVYQGCRQMSSSEILYFSGFSILEMRSSRDGESWRHSGAACNDGYFSKNN